MRLDAIDTLDDIPLPIVLRRVAIGLAAFLLVASISVCAALADPVPPPSPQEQILQWHAAAQFYQFQAKSYMDELAQANATIASLNAQIAALKAAGPHK